MTDAKKYRSLCLINKEPFTLEGLEEYIKGKQKSVLASDKNQFPKLKTITMDEINERLKKMENNQGKILSILNKLLIDNLRKRK